MPQPAVTIPADAMAKADEKVKGGTDYYADLTDEERLAEGLPPREPAKADPAPGDKPAEAKPAEKPDAGPEGDEDEDEDEDELAESDAAIEKLFEEVSKLGDKIDARLGETEPAKTEKEVDARLKAALESGDEGTRYLVEQLLKANERIERIEAAARDERIARERTKIDAEFESVQKSFVIDGRPMTTRQVRAVELYMARNEDVGAVLTIEEATRRVFPDAVKVSTKPPSAPGPGGSRNGKDSSVATIVDEGAAGGASAEPWKPRPNETVESAVNAAGLRLWNVKR